MITAMIEANTPKEFESGFHSENPSNVFRPFYARGIKNNHHFGFVFEEITDMKTK